jgi:hypothetical protein
MVGSGWTLIGFDEAYERWARTTGADDAVKRYVRGWISGLTGNHQPPGILPPMPGRTYLADPDDPDDTGRFEDCFHGFIRGLPTDLPLKIGYDMDLYQETIVCRYLYEHFSRYHDD